MSEKRLPVRMKHVYEEAIGEFVVETQAFYHDGTGEHPHCKGTWAIVEVKEIVISNWVEARARVEGEGEGAMRAAILKAKAALRKKIFQMMRSVEESEAGKVPDDEFDPIDEFSKIKPMVDIDYGEH
jgi:hypothetical protein